MIVDQSDSIQAVLLRIKLRKQQANRPQFDSKQLEELRCFSHVSPSPFKVSQRLLDKGWALIEEEVRTFFGEVHPQDSYTKFVLLTEFNFNGTFPLRLSANSSVKAKQRLEQESLWFHKGDIMPIPCCIDQTNKKHSNIANYFFIEPKVLSGEFPTPRGALENLQKFTDTRNNLGRLPPPSSSKQGFLPVAYPIQVIQTEEDDEERLSSDELEAMQIAAAQGSSPFNAKQLRDKKYTPVGVNYCSQSIDELPLTQEDWEAHWMVVSEKIKGFNLDQADSFTKVIDFWKSYYDSPPFWIVDEIIDRVFKFFNKVSVDKGILVEDSRHLRLHQNWIERLGQLVERIPFTLPRGLDEIALRLKEQFRPRQSSLPMEQDYRNLEQGLIQFIERIAHRYPQGLIPSGNDPFKDYDYITVDVSNEPIEQYLGKAVRKAFLDMLLALPVRCPSLIMNWSFFGKDYTLYLKNQLFYFQGYSLQRVNQLQQAVFTNYYNRNLCPLTGQPQSLESQSEMLHFMRRLRIDIQNQVFKGSSAMSKTTLMDRVEDGLRSYDEFVQIRSNLDYGLNEEVVDDFMDERNELKDTFLYDRKKFFGNHICQGQVFVTPQFLEHFDFRGITQFHVLRDRVSQICHQLGFAIYIQHTGTIFTQRQWWLPAYTFDCPIGKSFATKGMTDRLKWRQYKTVDEIQTKLENYQSHLEGVPPCDFRVHYRRSDPDDVNSDYMLFLFNLTHTHPLSPEYFRYYI